MRQTVEKQGAFEYGPATREEDAAPTLERGANLRGAEILEITEAWGILSRMAPDPARSHTFLAQAAGIRRADVAFLHGVRNRLAHPEDGGPPSTGQVKRALRIARDLRSKLG